MWAVAVAIGLILGGLIAGVWHLLSGRAQTAPLFNALGRSVRALLSDEGNFLREYLALLLSLTSFVFWNVMALVLAVAPAAVGLWLLWPYFEGNEVLLVVVLSLASVGVAVGLKIRSSRRGDIGRGLSVHDSQFFFVQLADSAPWLWRRGAALESRLLCRRLTGIDIDRPIFVTGLARSGTTMLLELLAQAEGVATHRYRDFPLLMTPWLWNRFINLSGRKGTPVQRPHQDGIRITPESPEAFEEPIWHHFFPDVHRVDRCHVLGSEDSNEAFNAFFIEHLQKMLLIRRGRRYLSKGNYNVTRIEYIASLLPDARFVVPIRHPVSHVASLVRQHALFCEYATEDPRVPQYLAAAGHFEFGPQRVPVSVDGSGARSLAAWDRGEEYRGYAIQWAAVYGHVLSVRQRSPQLTERVMVVRYEDLCADPGGVMTRVLQHVELEREGQAVLENLDHIRASDGHKDRCDSIAEAVWDETKDIAGAFGYEMGGG